MVRKSTFAGAAWLGTLLLATVLGLSACGHSTYNETEISGADASAVALDPKVDVFVAVPRDGFYGGRPFAGSGQIVASDTATAFARYAQHVETAVPDLQRRNDLLAAARDAHAGYLIVPNIVHWEPRATGWTGIPSRVIVVLTVIDVNTEREIRSAQLDARSSNKSTGGTDPEALYPHLIADYAAELYGAKAAPGKPSDK